MKNYYNIKNATLTLDECIRNGINTMQARGDSNIQSILNQYNNEGKNIQWIAQTASEIKDIDSNLKQIVLNNPIAIFHHGTHTDNLWCTGNSGIKTVKENLKKIRDTGFFTGIGTHKPEVIDYIENEGGDVDFYMTSLYNLAKTYKHVQSIQGFKEEKFEDEDMEPMLKRIKQTNKQCLVFKILGAGRKTNNLQETKNAFNYAFQNIKPQDCVVVGMYQKNKNQIFENSQIVKEILKDK